jgi:hypothetical protein
MDVPTSTTGLEALAELRRELQGELEGLVERRSGLERELEGLDKDIESKRRMLELVEATEEQLAAQGGGQRSTEGDGPGASTQVRGSAKLEDISEPVWPTWIAFSFSCDSPRQRLPSSAPDRLRPMPSRSLGHCPQGPSPRLCGRTTCCRC